MTIHHFVSYDETELGYHVTGGGHPLVCLPGGPGRASEYLGNLGGLDASRRLILLDPRGVGSSAGAANPANSANSANLRVDQLVHDVESLRIHLGLDRMDLLAHSAGSVLATLYAAAYPQRISRLILVTPGLAALGIYPEESQFDAILGRLTSEPWYPHAHNALERFFSGDLSMETFTASRPLFYARWNQTTQAHATMGVSERHQAARQGYFADAKIDPPTTRAAIKELAAPVLLHTGDLDPLVTPAMAQEAAELFPNATVVVQPGVGHFPWVDDPEPFAAAVSSFIRGT